MVLKSPRTRLVTNPAALSAFSENRHSSHKAPISLKRFRQPAMFPTYPSYGFAFGYPDPHVFRDNVPGSYSQGYPSGFPGAFGGWYRHAHEHETSPWAWQWKGETGTRQGPVTRYSNTATITQPRVQPTYGVDQAPSPLSRVVGGPVSIPTLGIICPRPIHPLPVWIDATVWEKVGGEESSGPAQSSVGNDDIEWGEGEDYDEELGAPRRFIPPFILSPDPEDLPAPFFPSRDSSPSSRTITSFSPDACDLPQPRFDSDPRLPAFIFNSQPTAPGFVSQHPPQYDPLRPTVFPDPGDLSPPNFEAYSQFEVEGFGRPDHRPDWTDDGGAQLVMRCRTGNCGRSWQGGKAMPGHRYCKGRLDLDLSR